MLSDVIIDEETSVKDQVTAGEGNSTTYTFSNVTSNHTITATFTPIRYTISYNLDGGTKNEKNPTSYTIETESFTLTNPTKDGYTFTGWTGSNGTTAQIEVTITTGSTGDRSYTANWEMETYAIAYDLNGGYMESGSNPTSYTVNSGDITLINPVRNGYSFSGWSGTDLTSNSISVTITSGSVGDRSYTANWTATIYTVRFNGNGATSGNMLSQAFEYGQSANLIANTFTRTGYTFNGWNTKADGSGISYTDCAKFSTNSNITLYAQWTSSTVYVEFDGNGATSGSMSAQSFTYGQRANLKQNSFVRTNYVFIGWNTSAYGNGTSYADGASFTASQNVTLYAQWTSSTVYVGFNGNGSTSGSMSAQTFTYGQSANLKSNLYSRTGYTFTGWNTKSNGSGTSYVDGAMFTATKSTTLYAQWTAVIRCECDGCNNAVTKKGDWCNTCEEVCSNHPSSSYCYEHCPYHTGSGGTSDDCSTCGGTGKVDCIGTDASEDWTHSYTVTCSHGHSDKKMYVYSCKHGCDGSAVKCQCGYENISHGYVTCPDCN